jgi:hypothetical protein
VNEMGVLNDLVALERDPEKDKHGRRRTRHASATG